MRDFVRRRLNEGRHSQQHAGDIGLLVGMSGALVFAALGCLLWRRMVHERRVRQVKKAQRKLRQSNTTIATSVETESSMTSTKKTKPLPETLESSFRSMRQPQSSTRTAMTDPTTTRSVDDKWPLEQSALASKPTRTVQIGATLKALLAEAGESSLPIEARQEDGLNLSSHAAVRSGCQEESSSQAAGNMVSASRDSLKATSNTITRGTNALDNTSTKHEQQPFSLWARALDVLDFSNHSSFTRKRRLREHLSASSPSLSEDGWSTHSSSSAFGPDSDDDDGSEVYFAPSVSYNEDKDDGVVIVMAVSFHGASHSPSVSDRRRCHSWGYYSYDSERCSL